MLVVIPLNFRAKVAFVSSFRSVNRLKGTADEYKLRTSGSRSVTPGGKGSASSSKVGSSANPKATPVRKPASGHNRATTPTGAAKTPRQMSLVESFNRTPIGKESR
jgi:hypothetical protein